MVDFVFSVKHMETRAPLEVQHTEVKAMVTWVAEIRTDGQKPLIE